MAKEFKLIEEPFLASPQRQAIRPGGLIGFLLKKNIAKTEKQAKFYLLIVLIICVFLIFILNRPDPALTESIPLEDPLTPLPN